MAGAVELGAMATMACTATTTMGIAAYSHMTHGSPSRNNHNVAGKTKHAGPLRKDDVLVRVDKEPARRKSIEFNGEVLCITDAGEELVPCVTLGGADVKVEGNRVIITPPELSTIVLDFPNAKDAAKWHAEMEEGVKVGAPHERVQELLMHSLRVEKHISDLRSRAATATQIQEQTDKLNKHLWPAESASKEAESASKDLEALKVQVQEQEEKKQKTQALAEDLKKLMADHVAPEDHDALHGQMEFHKEQCSQAQKEVARLQAIVDDLVPVVSKVQAQAAEQRDESALQRQELDGKGDRLAQQFAQRYQCAQMQLVTSEQRVREETARADSQSKQTEELAQANDALRRQLEEMKNSGRLVVQTGGARSQASTERFVDSRVENKGQSVEGMLVSNHKQLEAQRLDFAKQLNEQKQQHDIETAELKALQEKRRNMGSPTPGSLAVESDLRLSLKASDLAQENVRLKDQLAEQDREIERARKPDVLNVKGGSAGCPRPARPPAMSGDSSVAGYRSTDGSSTYTAPPGNIFSSPRVLVTQDRLRQTTPSSGRTGVARWISSQGPPAGIQGSISSQGALSDSRKATSTPYDNRTLSSTVPSTASSMKIPPRTFAAGPSDQPPVALRQLARVEDQMRLQQLTQTGGFLSQLPQTAIARTGGGSSQLPMPRAARTLSGDSSRFPPPTMANTGGLSHGSPAPSLRQLS